MKLGLARVSLRSTRNTKNRMARCSVGRRERSGQVGKVCDSRFATSFQNPSKWTQISASDRSMILPLHYSAAPQLCAPKGRQNNEEAKSWMAGGPQAGNQTTSCGCRHVLFLRGQVRNSRSRSLVFDRLNAIPLACTASRFNLVWLRASDNGWEEDSLLGCHQRPKTKSIWMTLYL